MLVEVAGTVLEVENGARLVVGELFEEDCGFMIFVEDARGAIAGEPGVEAGEGFGDAVADASGAGWVCLFEGGQAFAEACRILLSTIWTRVSINGPRKRRRLGSSDNRLKE
jgi:hypothetical protein